MRHLALGIVAAVLAAAPALAPQPAADTARMRTGRAYTRWFYEGKTDTLWALFTPTMRGYAPRAQDLAAFRGQVASQFGAETEVVSESVAVDSGRTAYTRVARFDRAGGPVRVFWRTDAGGRVSGFAIRPAGPATSRFLDYTTKTALRLPFEGDWFVVWGGRTQAQNYHVVDSGQRFAYDLLVMRDWKTHGGDGKTLEQYYCWGLPILAPGAGTIATAVDGLPDQEPGKMDPANPPGNHVVIDHGNAEFSLLGHLKRGSVAVRPGDRVEAGRQIGECGNSGNTSEPHLHYHMQNTGVFGRGEGLPAQFTGYVADGLPVERGEPVRGQTIRPR